MHKKELRVVVVVVAGVIVVVNTYKCRIGTCGGIGLPPGTVVVTEEAVDGRLRPFLDTVAFIVNIAVIQYLQRNYHLFVKTTRAKQYSPAQSVYSFK